MAEWMKAERVRAVAQRKVFLLEDDFVTIPGPRIVATVALIARVIHPEASWE
jgi:ABC-type Fe3+-hydroxamate transport system substrate-binding protein